MKILLGITGSIACYKAIDLARSLTKNNHEVIVILTKKAEEFIKPEIFQYLGIKATYCSNDDFNPNLKLAEHKSNVLHIELANWCDKFVIAPTTANTLAKLANGFCDDLLSSIFLSLKNKPVIIAPAMNTKMFQHQVTERNISFLKELPFVHILPTDSGELACGEVGEGKLLENDQILLAIETLNLSSNKQSQKILISTGASVAPLDPVRYLTNPASGKTGFELAVEALKNGNQVHVVSGPNYFKKFDQLNFHPNFKFTKGTTTRDMRDIIVPLFLNCDLYISAAAFCDIEFEISEGKIKKNNFTGILNYKQAPDILAELLSLKKEQQKIIGFAAETSDDQSVFLSKWQRKPVDLLVANVVNSGLTGKGFEKGFNTNNGQYYFVQNGHVGPLLELTKHQLASKILQANACN